MFHDYPWVPSAFILPYILVMLAMMSFFERRTRARVYNAATISIGLLAIYQLHANLSAGMDFISASAYLGVGITAVILCAKAATLERQMMLSPGSIQCQYLPQKQTASIIFQKTREMENKSEAERDIDSKIAVNKAQQQLEKEINDKCILAWFNDQIRGFSKREQLALRDCAEEFLRTGEINITVIPEHNTIYKQKKISEISSVFILAGISRPLCAEFAHIVFANFYRNTAFCTIRRKLAGVNKMQKVVWKFEPKGTIEY